MKKISCMLIMMLSTLIINEGICSQNYDKLPEGPVKHLLASSAQQRNTRALQLRNTPPVSDEVLKKLTSRAEFAKRTRDSFFADASGLADLLQDDSAKAQFGHITSGEYEDVDGKVLKNFMVKLRNIVMKLNSNNSEIQALQSRIQALQSEIVSIQEDTEDTKERYKKLQDKDNALQQELGTQILRNNNLHNQFQAADGLVKEQKKYIEARKLEIKLLMQEVENLHTENEKLSAELSQATNHRALLIETINETM